MKMPTKENDVLFPLAETILDEADQRAMRRDFDGVEAGLGPEGSLAAAEAGLDRLHRLARDASGRSGERQGED